MGDIGEDIKEAFTEVGRDFVIERVAGDVTGEYLLLDADYYAGISNLQLKCNFFYDTVVESGDLINMDGRRFIVSSVEPNEEENEIYLMVSELFECNVVGAISRHTEGTPYYDPNTFRTAPAFSVVYSDVYGCLVESLGVMSIRTSKDIQINMQSTGEQVIMFPKYNVIKAEDVYTLSGGTKYRIKTVEPRLSTDMQIAHTEVDVRES